MEEQAQGGEPLPLLSRWRRSANGGTIAALIVFINITFIITILISFMRSTLPHPAVIPNLNMALYATVAIQPQTVESLCICATCGGQLPSNHA